MKPTQKKKEREQYFKIIRGVKVKTCCFSIRKAIVLIPRRQSQQSKGANPEPSEFWRKYTSFANLEILTPLYIRKADISKKCLRYLKAEDTQKQKRVEATYFSPLTASTPAITSLCPAINLVAECITMSRKPYKLKHEY